MKKWIRAACSGVLLAAVLTVPALASDFDDCASRLKGMKLFQGTSQGYELDRAPTRAEAGVMLVRLLGQEGEMKELSYSAPFEDVADWEKPYVQYLYGNGITTGVSETEFKPEEKCTAQMYAAFLLRALGYTGEDFKYADAIAFAERIGLYSGLTVDTENFLRDHVVSSSYTALSLPPKGKDGTLLDLLVDEGAVTEKAAGQYQKRFGQYNNYVKAARKMKGLSAMALRHEFTVTTDTLSIKSNEAIEADFSASTRKSVRNCVLSAPGAEDKAMNAESYLADGNYYMVQNGTAIRRKLTDEQFKRMVSEYYVVPVAMIAEIEEAGAIYTITYNRSALSRLGGLLDTLSSAAGDLDDLKVSGLTVKQDISNGIINSQRISMEFESSALKGSVSSVMTLEGVDGEVKLVPPANLDKYTLVR